MYLCETELYEIELSRQLYGHQPPITKTIQVRRARNAGHCWRSKDELVSDVLLWTPTYGQAKAGRPARTYIQQLCEDTGCNPENLLEAMNDREKWRERVRDIRAGGTTWWWWWWWFVLKWIWLLITYKGWFAIKPKHGKTNYLRKSICHETRNPTNHLHILVSLYLFLSLSLSLSYIYIYIYSILEVYCSQ